MKPSSITVALLAVACAACAARPTPAARVGSAEAAVRAARESGATGLPDAALHLRLAEQQVARARRLIQEGEHERAQWLLVRAEADAMLAQALAVEAQHKNAAEMTATRARELAAEGAMR
jgi:hypothetical protein